MKILRLFCTIALFLAAALPLSASGSSTPARVPSFLSKLERILKQRALDQQEERSLNSLKSSLEEIDQSQRSGEEDNSQQSDPRDSSSSLQDSSRESDLQEALETSSRAGQRSDRSGEGSTETETSQKSGLQSEEADVDNLSGDQRQKLDEGIQVSQASRSQTSQDENDKTPLSGAQQLEQGSEISAKRDTSKEGVSQASDSIESGLEMIEEINQKGFQSPTSDEDELVTQLADPSLEGENTQLVNTEVESDKANAIASGNDSLMRISRTEGVSPIKKTKFASSMGQMEAKGDKADTLSDLVEDFAHEAVNIASQDYPMDQEELSATDADLNVPSITANVRTGPGMRTGGQGLVLKRPVIQTGVHSVVHNNLVDGDGKDVPSELIDDILRQVQAKRAKSFVIDQDADMNLGMGGYGPSGQSVQIQRMPVIQSVGDGSQYPINSTITTATQTSVNPVDQSVSHDQIQHTVHENTMTGQQLHTLEGQSVNIGDSGSGSAISTKKNPFRAIVNGLINAFNRSRRGGMFGSSSQEVPVLITKSSPSSIGAGGSGQSSMGPFSQIKTMFNFGKPNGSANDFSDYSNDSLIKIMDGLKDSGTVQDDTLNPLGLGLGMTDGQSVMNSGSDLTGLNDQRLNDKLEDLFQNGDRTESQNLDGSGELNVSKSDQKPNLGDLSEGDEILFHSGNHDDSELSKELDGNEVMELLGTYKPSNRLRDNGQGADSSGLFGSSNRLREDSQDADNSGVFGPSNRLKDTEMTPDDLGLFGASNRLQDGNQLNNQMADQDFIVDENQVLRDHLNAQTADDKMRQKAVDDLLEQLIGSTDFNSVSSSGSQHPLMGDAYSTSSMGLPLHNQLSLSSMGLSGNGQSTSLLTPSDQAVGSIFGASNRLSDQDLGQLGLSQSGKKFTDIDDLIGHLQNNDVSLGVKQNEKNATDDYLLNVLRQNGMDSSEPHDLNPSDLEFFKALNDDSIIEDLNSADHKILNEKNVSKGKQSLTVGGKNKMGADQDEDVLNQALYSTLTDNKGASGGSDMNILQTGNDKGMDILSKHSILGAGGLGKMNKNKVKFMANNPRISSKSIVGSGKPGAGQMRGKGKGQIIIGKGAPPSSQINQFGSTQFPPGQFNPRVHRHHSHRHSSTSTHVDTTELTQVLSQLARAFGGRHHHRHHRHHRHHHRGSHTTNINSSTNVHINQGGQSTVNTSRIHSSSIEKNSKTVENIRKKENKIVNIENVIHHIYRQPKRKQKINIKVTVKPMGGFKSSGPCEDNCEEEINKHIEEIMDLENTKSEATGRSSMSNVSENTQVNSESADLQSADRVVDVSEKSGSPSQSDSSADQFQVEEQSRSNSNRSGSTDREDTNSQASSNENASFSVEPKGNERLMSLMKEFDQDGDTFYNNANGEERRLAQREFRRSIQKMARQNHQ